ncbi:MAG TPA: cytochrome c [Pirellulales bacterium]|nr:cytochrome c [Pirellulales bacterium]
MKKTRFRRFAIAGRRAADFETAALAFAFLVPIVWAMFATADDSAPSNNSSNAAQKDTFAAPPAKWDSRVTDAFPSDPTKLLNGPRPDWMTAVITGHGKPPAKNNAAASGQPGNATAGADQTGALTWSKIISADTLQDEIKSLQPLLADDVKTQPEFLGGAYKKSRKTLSLLAVAFAIINEYDGDVKWKSQAPLARDVFARSGYNCKASTEQTFRDVKQRSEDLAALLSGETLSGSKAEPTNDWSKVANLLPLMSRLEAAQRDRIAPWTSNAGDFKKNAAAITHEAEIIAALAEAISRSGMENADDEKFRGYAKALQQSALKLRDAANNADYASANTAAGTLSKACANCHNDFR